MHGKRKGLWWELLTSEAVFREIIPVTGKRLQWLRFSMERGQGDREWERNTGSLQRRKVRDHDHRHPGPHGQSIPDSKDGGAVDHMDLSRPDRRWGWGSAVSELRVKKAGSTKEIQICSYGSGIRCTFVCKKKKRKLRTLGTVSRGLQRRGGASRGPLERWNEVGAGKEPPAGPASVWLADLCTGGSTSLWGAVSVFQLPGEERGPAGSRRGGVLVVPP